ncbi:hypothetical protein JTB14_027632 [Gonioctena quinquepunctata]|nr:hypothetical protein JTB14_027632 [Gonioctena quinquepunctata]
MKVLIAICTIFLVGYANCGIITGPAVARTTTYQSQSFTPFAAVAQFNPVYSRAVPYVQHVAQPVVSNQAPFSYALPQQYYSQAVLPQRAVPYVQHVAQPVVSNQAPLSYALPQSYYSQAVLPQHLFTPSVVSTPHYSGLYAGSPFIAQAPVGAGSFVPGLPSQIFGSFPAQEPAPVQGQAPGQLPIESAESPAASQPQADSPSSGTTFDDDTVSVEAA